MILVILNRARLMKLKLSQFYLAILASGMLVTHQLLLTIILGREIFD